MSNNNIKTSIVFDAETYDGYPLQFWYNGSLTINVFTGIRDSIEEELQDRVEVDVMTISNPGLVNALAAVRLYVDEFVNNGECDCGATYNAASRVDHDADTGQCWSCSDRHPDSMSNEEWDRYIEGSE